MLVTLCVIAYNEERFLPRLFSDIEQQTYEHKKIELVLVNNGSDDRKRAIMAQVAAESDLFDVKIIDQEKSNQAAGWKEALRQENG